MAYSIHAADDRVPGVDPPDLEFARAQAAQLSHEPARLGVPITVRDEDGRLYGMFIDGVEVGEVLGGP